ncbi:MAG: class I SAM-dependent methyltransferase [Myxococcota bacterium]
MADTAAKTYGCTDVVTAEYAVKALTLEDDILQEVRARTAAAGMPDIHVAASDGRHLQVLAAAVGAKKAVEVGTLAGYSGVCLLRGMGEGGFLHTLELHQKHADVAAETFRRAGVSNRVRIHVGKASENLQKLSAEGPFDLVFLDADKAGYPGYLAWAAENLRVGGVVIADNVFLWDSIGRSASDARGGATQGDIDAMRRFNETVIRSERFMGTLLPTGEGLALGVKVR